MDISKNGIDLQIAWEGFKATRYPTVVGTVLGMERTLIQPQNNI